MKIILLSSVYPAEGAAKGTTPVVHYFAKDWVAMGHQVHVFHTKVVLPQFYYWVGRLFGKKLYSRLGYAVANKKPRAYEEIKDGVRISHLLIKKYKPHGRYSDKAIRKTMSAISDFLDKEGIPDCFVGHWDNPQLELLNLLKERYNRPVSLVYHNNNFNHLYKIHGKTIETLVQNIDLVGFRSITARANYENLFGKVKPSFLAFSGVSDPFIKAGVESNKDICEIKRFVFVGALIERKYPRAVIQALSKAYKNDPFEITYIGEGDEKSSIQHWFSSLGCNGKLTFTGRIPREEVIRYLKQSDVFVMISLGEVFGLVYLEAMALGCITIASRNQGMDGIIMDNVNGFLCEAGNEDELSDIITKIRQMPIDTLMEISNNAKQTAQNYSDMKVALNYSNELSSMIDKYQVVNNNCK